MYIFVCFLLWVLYQVISIDARCPVESPDSNCLYIMETPNNYHKLRNELFIDRLSSFLPLAAHYDIYDYKILKNCSSHLTDIITDSYNLRFMVHLQVEDFYQNNYNNLITHGFEWADDVANCIQVNGKKKCNDNVRENNRNKKKKKLVNLVSEPVTSISTLYDMVMNFQNKPLLYRILVCSQYVRDLDPYTVNLYSKVIKFQLSNHCDDPTALGATLHKNIIAILAPNPSFVTVTLKPVIFYQKPYFIPKATELYDNGIIRIGSMKTLAHALLQLIKRYWNRVAIISDDSEESYNFEQELRFLFEKEDISFAVMAVSRTDQDYDFSEVLATLKKYDARIIIANMKDKLADTLGYQAKEHQLTISHKVLWIAPGWSTGATKIAAESMGTVLNLLPSELYNEKQNILNYIHRIVEFTLENQGREDYDYSDSQNFARDLKKHLNWTNEDVDVYQTVKDNSDVVATFSKGSLTMKAFYVPTDGQEGCLFKSQNYFKPCDDMDLIYIMLIIMVFAVSILGITFFFDTNHTPYNRM